MYMYMCNMPLRVHTLCVSAVSQALDQIIAKVFLYMSLAYVPVCVYNIILSIPVM